jgi:hypothetical protein
MGDIHVSEEKGKIMKSSLPRDSAVLAAYRGEISLSEKKVVSKKVFSRSRERVILRNSLSN